MGRRIICAATLCCAVIACGKAPRTYNFDRSVQFTESSYDDVWDTVVELFAERQWPIQEMEKDSGLIATDWARHDEDGLSDCGSGPLTSLRSTANHAVRSLCANLAQELLQS